MWLREWANWWLQWPGVAPAPLLSLAGWVAYGGPGRDPFGVTHTHCETHRRPGATQAGPTIAVGDMVSPSHWQRRGCVYVCVCMRDPTLEAPTPPLLRTLAAARHHIPMVTPLLSLLIKIREIYLCVHTQHMHAHRANRWQALLGTAGPLQRLNIQRAAHSFSAVLPRERERKWEEEDKIKGETEKKR